MLCRIAILSLLCLLLFGAESIQAQDVTGVWRGKWTANASARRGEHGGALRVKLTPTGPCTYRGTFSGRFALVIPYFYRADVVQYGSTLHSSKKLGPLGDYQMDLQVSEPYLSGSWRTTNHSGRIQLQRRR